MSQRLYEFTFLCDGTYLTAYAANLDLATEIAGELADTQGLRGPIQCVDRAPYDPCGGDRPDD